MEATLHFPTSTRVHFIGIGGVGMSGIAEVLLNLGYPVSGSDLKASEVTRRLEAHGAVVRAGHRAENVRGAQVVVVSSAVAPANPEVREARRLGIPIIPRAEMLAELARMKKTVTISGSHGKTTTTSMVGMALQAAGADPTLIVGGQVKNLASNARVGLGEFIVAEADESDGSFLKLSPRIAIVTNVDTDHLDHYGTLENLKEAFVEHVAKVPFYGCAILCADDPVLRSLLPRVSKPRRTYGFSAGADYRPADVRLSAHGSSFTVRRGGRSIARVRLQVAGRHNVLNATAAVACADVLGLPLGRAAEGLAAFRGVGRRLETLGKAAGVTFMDDYGHHPTEIRTTLKALTGLFDYGRLIVLFQPHRYTRTKLLAREFGPAFRGADRAYVLDIYPAGEKPLPGVSSRLILDSMRRAGVDAQAFPGPLEVAKELRPGDLVLTVGAGDVWKVGEDLKRRLAGNALSPV